MFYLLWSTRVVFQNSGAKLSLRECPTESTLFNLERPESYRLQHCFQHFPADPGPRPHSIIINPHEQRTSYAPAIPHFCLELPVDFSYPFFYCMTVRRFSWNGINLTVLWLPSYAHRSLECIKMWLLPVCISSCAQMVEGGVTVTCLYIKLRSDGWRRCW
jgi:hypothetical protein